MALRGEDDLKLADRYEVEEELGVGGQGTTFAAQDIETGTRVALKELTVGRVLDWKELELFEREATALAQLDHPGIPRFVDSFEAGTDDAIRFYLVQELVDGETLANLVKQSGTLNADRVKEIIEELLHTLSYLQGFSPPVLHRDIKPPNVIQRPDGSLALVDFGAVQLDSHGTTGGSTVVGTTGYMPPEQLMGKATRASDLFGLGATAVNLLTGMEPTELPVERMKLKWRRYAKVPSDLADFIDRLIEPVPTRRFASADVALESLRNGFDSTVEPIVRQTSIARVRPRPVDTKFELTRTSRRLEVRFQPSGIFPVDALGLIVGLAILMFGVGFGAIFIPQLGGFMPAITVAVGVCLLFILGGFALVFVVIRGMRRVSHLMLDVDDGYRVKSSDGKTSSRGPLSRIVAPHKGVGQSAGHLSLELNDGEVNLTKRATNAEQDWVFDEIVRFLKQARE